MVFREAVSAGQTQALVALLLFRQRGARELGGRGAGHRDLLRYLMMQINEDL